MGWVGFSVMSGPTYNTKPKWFWSGPAKRVGIWLAVVVPPWSTTSVSLVAVVTIGRRAIAG